MGRVGSARPLVSSDQPLVTTGGALPLPTPAQPATLTAMRVASKAARILVIGTPCLKIIHVERHHNYETAARNSAQKPQCVKKRARSAAKQFKSQWLLMGPILSALVNLNGSCRQHENTPLEFNSRWQQISHRKCLIVQWCVLRVSWPTRPRSSCYVGCQF